MIKIDIFAFFADGTEIKIDELRGENNVDLGKKALTSEESLISQAKREYKRIMGPAFKIEKGRKLCYNDIPRFAFQYRNRQIIAEGASK